MDLKTALVIFKCDPALGSDGLQHKRIIVIVITENKGKEKEKENSYQKLKRSLEERHMET